MAHLLFARKAEPVGAAGFSKADLALYGERGAVEGENSRRQRHGSGDVEIPVDNGLDCLGHEAPVPEGLSQPIADHRALRVRMETGVADQALARQFESESGFARRPVGPPSAKPRLGVGFAIWIGHARQIAGDAKVVEVAGDASCIVRLWLPEQQTPGAKLYIHLGLSSSSSTRGLSPV